MNNVFEGRKFQLWEYKVSHGSLLVRSPKVEVEGQKKNVDIVFVGVEYISVPRFLKDLMIDKPNQEEVAAIEKLLTKDVLPENIFILTSGENRYAIVAASHQVSVNELDIFESPFQ